MLLQIERLTLYFGGLAALNGVDLALGEGELLALIGPNGAGKTCVLNCISGLYRPSSGSIRFAGRNITGLRPDQVAQMGIGRTFQHVELFRQLNVLQNVLLGRHLHIRSNLVLDGFWWGPARKEEISHCHAVEQILELLQLDALTDRPVSELPYGVQKLVGIARALAMEPRLLLLDEPSAGMNRQDKEHLARVLVRIKERLQIPMLWVEHDMELVADLADRVQVLHYGQEIAHGKPDDVLRHPDVVRVYLGHSLMSDQIAQ